MKRALFLFLALPACLFAPEDPAFRPPEIRGGSPGGPDRLAVAAVDTDGLAEALEAAGFGLRVIGERGELRLRALAPPPGARERLAAACGVLPFRFSAPAAFRPGDDLTVSAFEPGPPLRGFSLDLRAHGGPAGVVALETAAVARPADGSLLPVMTGEVPVPGPGPILLAGERAGTLVFAALLLLETAGGTAAPPPREHVLTLRAFLVPTEDLPRLLPDDVPPAAAEEFSARRMPAVRAEALPEALAAAGRVFPPEERRFASGDIQTFDIGGLALVLREEFRLADYSYHLRAEILNRPGSTVSVSRGERDTALLLGRDARAPGTSVVVLLRSRPAPGGGER